MSLKSKRLYNWVEGCNSALKVELAHYRIAGSVRIWFLAFLLLAPALRVPEISWVIDWNQAVASNAEEVTKSRVVRSVGNIPILQRAIKDERLFAKSDHRLDGDQQRLGRPGNRLRSHGAKRCREWPA